MTKFKLESINLTLKSTWRISRGSDDHKKNYIVTVGDESFFGQGEAAFLTGTDHSEEKIKTLFDSFCETLPEYLSSIEEIQKYLLESELPNPLKFAVESGFIHMLGQLLEKETQEILGVNKISKVKTSISLPIMEVGKIAEYIKNKNLNRFHSLKVKVDSENAVDTCLEAVKYFHGSLRIDANECFSTVLDALFFMERIQGKANIDFIEQPLGADKLDEQLELKKRSPFLLMADESVQDVDINQYIRERFHGVNIKTMKAGGYFRAIKQLRDAKSLGLKTMLGCMVETSLGISSSLNIAYGVDYIDLDGALLLENDPFHLVYEEGGELFFAHFQ